MLSLTECNEVILIEAFTSKAKAFVFNENTFRKNR